MTKWAAPTRTSRSKSQNHCDELLVALACEGFFETPRDALEFYVHLSPSTNKACILDSWESIKRDLLKSPTYQKSSQYLEEEVETLRRELVVARADLSAALQLQAAESQRVSELTASTSWRLTAPLRATKTFLKTRIQGLR